MSVDGRWILAGIVLAVLGIGFLAGSESGQADERDRATAVGAGRWTINPTNGAKTFVYGTPRLVIENRTSLPLTNITVYEVERDGVRSRVTLGTGLVEDSTSGAGVAESIPLREVAP